jgi:ankyrin repeat protein
LSSTKGVAVVAVATIVLVVAAANTKPGPDEDGPPLRLEPINIELPITSAARNLFSAVTAGNVADATAALRAHPDLIRYRFGDEGTALHVAARLNQAGIVHLLLERGADLHDRGVWSGTPLHWAAWWGSREAVEELISQGAMVEARGDAYSATPLLWAAYGSSHMPQAKPAAPRAPKPDHVGVVQVLIEHGASPNTYNSAGTPAVVLASKEVAEVLKSHGATATPMPSAEPGSLPQERPHTRDAETRPAPVPEDRGIKSI